MLKLISQSRRAAKFFFSHRLKRLKGFFQLPPALAGGIKVELEKALAKQLQIWLKPFKLNYFSIQLKLDATQKNFVPLRLCEINQKQFVKISVIRGKQKIVTIYHTNLTHKKRTFKYLSKL